MTVPACSICHRGVRRQWDSCITFPRCACLEKNDAQKDEKAVLSRGLAGGNRVCCRLDAKAETKTLALGGSGRGAWKGKKSPCLCLVLVECTSSPQSRVLAQYGLPRCILCSLNSHLGANGPVSRAGGSVIGLRGSQISRQGRPAPWRTQEGTPEPRQEMPSRIFVHSPSSLVSVHSPSAARYAPTSHLRTTDPPGSWWEIGTRQELSWPPSPSNLSSVWRPQRVDGINIARQATSRTSSFPLLSSRRRYPSPR
jgi:hypothetical protein